MNILANCDNCPDRFNCLTGNKDDGTADYRIIKYRKSVKVMCRQSAHDLGKEFAEFCFSNISSGFMTAFREHYEYLINKAAGK